MTLFKLSALALMTTALLSGCGGSNDSNSPAQAPAFELQLLHFADMDGSGSSALQNVEAFSAVLDALRSQMPDNTLVLSSGDNYIPGPRYSAAANPELAQTVVGTPGVGRGDIALLNALGVQASVVGNHDLDGGTAEFDSIISAGGSYAGAQFAYLSSNLDFSTDTNLADNVKANGQDLSTLGAGALSGYGTLEVNGETIGIIGASTPTLANITNTGGITVLPGSSDIDALAARIQTGVDALTATGVNKVILLAHMQEIRIEKELAAKLSGVDIIVAGGSNTLLADDNDPLRSGDSAQDTYPLAFSSATDEPVLLVNTDADYKYLGRLLVGFNADGVILPNTLDTRTNGVYAATQSTVDQLKSMPIALVSSIKTALNIVLAKIDGNILGNTSVYLEGRRGQVRTQETNLGNLSADANLWLARQYDPSVQVSIKNGGGIRASIGSAFVPAGSTSGELTLEAPSANPAIGKQLGDISQLAIQESLRFNNGLVVGDVTPAELLQLLEHAVSGVENTAGQFPQVGGMRFEYNPSATARVAEGTNVTRTGSRVSKVVLIDDSGNDVQVIVDNGAVLLSAPASIRLVTLGFLAQERPNGTGGDGYPFMFPIENFVDLSVAPLMGSNLAQFANPGSEQDALAEYLLATFPDQSKPFTLADTPVAQDKRILNLNSNS